MRGLWTHLERLGAGRIDGGIGTRGPGESQIETDRRLARDRITTLRRRLVRVERNRGVQRARREASTTPTVALAGYTNAGKSTLLNALTGAGVGVGERLFQTLDPTTRAYEHHGRRFLVTDTVGFIRKLPHQLVEAFKATLEETRLADMIVHVVDGSEPEAIRGEAIAAVDAVLEEIGAGDRPRLLVFNKLDLLDADARSDLLVGDADAVGVSAATGQGLDELRDRIESAFVATLREVELLVPYSEGARLSEIHELAGELERTERAGRGARQGEDSGRADPPLRAVLGQRGTRFAVSTSGAALQAAGGGCSDARAREPRRRGARPARRRAGDASSRRAGGRPSAPGSRSRSRPGTRALVLPRSGLAARHGIGLANAPGLIDPGYRGEIRVLLANNDPHEPFEVRPGDRIAQLLLVPFIEAEPLEVGELSETARGEGGFGSSGA